MIINSFSGVEERSLEIGFDAFDLGGVFRQGFENILDM